MIVQISSKYQISIIAEVQPTTQNMDFTALDTSEWCINVDSCI